MAQSSLAEKIEPEIQPVASWEVVVASASVISKSGRDAYVTLVCNIRGMRMIEEQGGRNIAEAALNAIRQIMPAEGFVERPEVHIVGLGVEARVIVSRGNICVIGTSRNPEPAAAVAKAYLHALLQLDKGPK